MPRCSSSTMAPASRPWQRLLPTSGQAARMGVAASWPKAKENRAAPGWRFFTSAEWVQHLPQRKRPGARVTVDPGFCFTSLRKSREAMCRVLRLLAPELPNSDALTDLGCKWNHTSSQPRAALWGARPCLGLLSFCNSPLAATSNPSKNDWLENTPAQEQQKATAPQLG